MLRACGCVVLIWAVVLTGSCGSGEPVQPTTVEITVVGMHCTGCEDGIRGTVGRLEGVDTVHADHVAGRAVISFRPDTTTVDEIVAAIEELGFQAAPLGDGDAVERSSGEGT
jgi:copper chaperone CopZ